MILMGVGDEDAGKIGAFLLEVGNVGEDEVDPGELGPGEATPKSTTIQVRSLGGPKP
jgi:hypothetical protein